MKKYIILVIILIIGLGFLSGYYFYKIGQKKENGKEYIAEKLIDDECTEIAEREAKIASNQENKISPNCTLTIRILYTQCNHLAETSEKISDEKLVNLTEEEFKEKYKEWEIQKFTSSEIVIYKQIDAFCNQHYKLKERDGYIAVYKLDKQNNETLEKQTDILLEYLAQKDIENIKNGIMVYSKKELNKVLEDFE